MPPEGVTMWKCECGELIEDKYNSHCCSEDDDFRIYIKQEKDHVSDVSSVTDTTRSD
jgi:hypothetical protein